VKTSPLQSVVLVLAWLSLGAGVLGMLASFLYLASSHNQDVLAGVGGFVAGAMLIGSGILSLAVLATRGSDVPGGSSHPSATVGLPQDDEWRMKSGR
jgi:hypothetical protein